MSMSSGLLTIIKILNNSKLERGIGGPEAKALRRVLTDSAAENPHITVEFID